MQFNWCNFLTISLFQTQAFSQWISDVIPILIAVSTLKRSAATCEQDSLSLKHDKIEMKKIMHIIVSLLNIPLSHLEWF